MNWLIWEKMFIHFYNKFTPLNCMCFIKCGANITQLMWIWLLQMICGTLDHCLVTNHYSECILHIFFGMILCETRHHAQTHFQFRARAKLTQQQSVLVLAGQYLLVRLSSLAAFVEFALGLLTKQGVGQSWLLPAAWIKFLSRKSLKSRCVYFTPHEDNRI
jgi:hypothetical protein